MAMKMVFDRAAATCWEKETRAPTDVLNGGFIAVLGVGGQTMVLGTPSLFSSRETNLKGKLNRS